ncbi:MAG: hypothetical protein AAGG02_16665 [Cyanobacteria bacterium P01_H01_bin.15]
MAKSQLTTLAAVSVSSLSFVSGQTAEATSLINSAGLADPGITITADEIVLENEAVVTNQYESLGVNFSPNVLYNSQSESGSLGNFAPAVTGNYFGQALL